MSKLEQLLVEQNPHWSERYQYDGLSRAQFQTVIDYLALPHIIAITGVRRCGKSTLLKQVMDYLINQQRVSPKNILFMNLEQPYLLQYASDINYLESIFQTWLTLQVPQGQLYVLLDEIQFFAHWPVFVKAHYESQHIKFIITGSNSSLLSSDLITLLSGRALAVELYPFSLSELMMVQGVSVENKTARYAAKHVIQNNLRSYIEYGGFPEIVTLENKQLSTDILEAYAKTIVFQDIAPRLNVRKSAELEMLFIYLITHIGSLSSYHKLAAHFSLSDKIIKDYIHAFSDAYLLFELEKFSFSLTARARAPKKIYAIDTGMANACGFRFSPNHGKLLENIIFIECKRRKYEIFYYKTAQDYEIDFLIKTENRLYPIQVAWDISQMETYTRETRALTAALNELQLDQAFLISLADAPPMPLDDARIQYISACEWLLINYCH